MNSGGSIKVKRHVEQKGLQPMTRCPHTAGEDIERKYASDALEREEPLTVKRVLIRLLLRPFRILNFDINTAGRWRRV